MGPMLLLALGALVAAKEPKPSAGLDCAVRQLAYEFATQLQPERGRMPDVAAGLQLQLSGSSNGTTCAKERAGGDAAWPADYAPRGYLQAAYSPVPPPWPRAPLASSAVYVSYATGSDTAAGTATQPLKTIAAGLAATARLPAPRQVLLHAGLHTVAATLVLGAANSHTTIMPAPGAGAGEVTVSGAVHLLRPAWTPAPPPPGQQLGAGVALIKTSLPATVKLEALEAFGNATERLVAGSNR